MKKIIILMVMSFCLADTNIGWVDSQYIFNQLEETREAQVQIEKKQNKLESDLMDMVGKRDSLIQDYQSKAPLMSAEMQKSKESEILNFEKEIEMFQMQKMGPEGELYTYYAQLIAPIEKKILAAIEKVGNAKGYDYILDSSRGGIVHALDSHKLDEDVLEELRKGATSE